MNLSLCKDNPGDIVVLGEDLDHAIDAAEAAADMDTLSMLVHTRLERRGTANSVSLILMAQDLYMIYTHMLWQQAGYTSFPEWVEAEFSPRPYGRKYQTVMALIGIWSFYAIECQWSIADLAHAGKAKLERGLAEAKATANGDGNIDNDLRAVLLDNEVKHRDMMDDYHARKRQRELRNGKNDLSEQSATNHSPPRRPYYEADTRTGELRIWIPIDGQKQNSVSVILGKLHFQNKDTEPWLTNMLHRAGVVMR
jgi:hypothetical protein